MKRIVPTILILGLAACSSTGRGRNYGNHNFNANCEVDEQFISVEIETGGSALRDVELMMQDGTVVRPDVVQSRRGKEIALRIVADSPDSEPEFDTKNQPSRLIAKFGNRQSSGPRQLILTPEHGDSTAILLADIEHEDLGHPYDGFGYQREDRIFPDGTVETMFSRFDSEGQRHDVSPADFEGRVAPSLNRLFSHLPATAKEFSDAQAIREFLAEAFEAGVSYEGVSSGEEGGMPVHGMEFHANPVRVVFYDDEGREQKAEDPLSTITRVVLAAFNASTADELEEIYEAARNGDLDESQFIRAEALYKARNIQRTIQLIQENSDELSVDRWRDQKYGHYYSLYSSWVNDASAGSESEDALQSKLAGSILSSRTRKGTQRGEKPITYHLRLQRLYAQLLDEGKARAEADEE